MAIAVLSIFVIGLAGSAIHAQTLPAQQTAIDAATAPGPFVRLREKLDSSKVSVEALKAQIQNNETDDTRLVDMKAQADGIARDVVDASAGLRPRAEEIKARLTELGEAPAEGQPPEAEIVASERARLTAERAEINALIGEAEATTTTATQLANTITAIRRSLFNEALFKRTEISIGLFAETSKALWAEAASFQRTLNGWFTFVWNYKRIQLLSATFLSIAAALIFLAGGYRLFGGFMRRNKRVENPTYIQRLSMAFWSVVIQQLTLGAFLVSCAFFLNNFNVLRTDIAPVVMAGLTFVGLVYFVVNLSYAVLSPQDPAWRLVRVSNSGARALVICATAMVAINGLDYVLAQISESMSSPIILTVAKSFFASVLIGVILFVMSFLRPVMAENGDPEYTGRPWPRSISYPLRIAGFLLIFAAATGYVGLARFMATQIVVTGAVSVTIYIGLLSGKYLSKQGAFAETAGGRFLADRYKFGVVAIDQIGLLVGLAIYLFALAFGIPLILFSWGFQVKDMELWAYRLFTDITIGNISISLVGIFGGIVLFVLGMMITRWVQKWLDGNVMARSRVDMGVRNSVKTGIGYLGIGVAGIVGISAAGFDLSSLAIVAGALSLGIGFGLQNIVQNFVSGLILLVERPFKVGDWVVTGTTEGTVKRISVRATEIETFRSQSIIVPNSEFINSPVGNWTHRNRMSRAEIPVSVSYDADPRKVMDTLLALVSAQPLIMRNPEPHVEFLRFGEFSMDFELRFFLADLSNGLTVKNDLRIAILSRFREEGIELPSPQRHVNVHVDADGHTVTTLEDEDEQEQAAASNVRRPVERKN